MGRTIPRLVVVATALLLAASASIFSACGDVTFSSDDSSGDASSDTSSDTTTSGDGASSDGSVNVCTGFDPSTFDFDAADTTTVRCVDGGFPTVLSGDSLNCGYCGHDCLGSTCTGGLCDPTTIYQEGNEGGVPATGGLAVVAITGGRIYWSYPTSDNLGTFIRRMALDGSSAPELLTTTGAGPISASADPSGAYYTINGELHVIASTDDTDLGAGFGTVTSIATDDSNVYLSSTSPSGEVVAFGKLDHSVTTISGMEDTPIDVVLDKPWVEWLDVTWLHTPAAGSTLVRRQNGSVVAPTSLGHASSLAVDMNRNLYWYDDSTHALMQLAEDDPNAVPVAIGTYDVNPDAGSLLLSQGIVVDGARAYVAIPEPFSGYTYVIEFSLCGGKPKRLTPLVPMIGAIFQDEKMIYWGESGGALRSLAK